MRCFDVEFWGDGMELHFDGEEAAIVVCGNPDSDMPVLNIFNYYDLDSNAMGDGLLLETEARDYIIGDIG
jgi:hypothetical protein